MNAADVTPPSSGARPGPLDDVLRVAGARMVERGGRRVAADFGSIVGEVAVCRHTVGLVDRSDRITFEALGDTDALDAMTKVLTGRRVGRGTAIHVADGWVCRLSPERLLVRCEARDAERCHASLVSAAGDGVQLRDASEEHAGVGLVGPHAEALLRGLGLPEGTPIARVAVHGVPALLLREDEHLFEVIEQRDQAREVWEALREAGRSHGVSCVGCDALAELHAVAPRRAERDAARG